MATTTHETIPGRSYCLRATSSTTVTTTREGTSYTLASHSGDGSELYFTAISPEIEVNSAGKYAIQELFSAAPLASAGGGGGSLEMAGIMPVKYINWSNPILEGGVMYTVDALTDLWLSDFTLPAQANQCITCELVVNSTPDIDSAQILWPESWEWVNGIGLAGSAPTLEGFKHYYFAIRTMGSQTVINHYLTTD